MKRKMVAVGAAAGIAAVTLFGTAGVASASDGNAYVYRATGVYNSPSTKAQAPWTLNPKPVTQVEALCFVVGEEVRGNPFWFRIKLDDRQGFVPREVIGGLPQSLPGC